MSDNLTESSKKHLDYLISIGEISHNNSEDGSLIRRVTDAGVSGLYSGEIIGYADSIEKLLELWKKSPEHNSVLLDKQWNWLGFGIVRYEELFISVVNFSSGQLGSIKIYLDDNKSTLKGLYRGEPHFKLDSSIDIKKENGEIEIVLPVNNRVFFIYVYDENGNLTDQINIF